MCTALQDYYRYTPVYIRAWSFYQKKVAEIHAQCLPGCYQAVTKYYMRTLSMFVTNRSIGVSFDNTKKKSEGKSVLTESEF